MSMQQRIESTLGLLQPEHLQVLDDRGDRHVERLCEAADRGRPRAESLQDAPASRLGERFERAVHSGIFKH